MRVFAAAVETSAAADRAARGTLSVARHALGSSITLGSITVTLGGLLAAIVIVAATIAASRILRAGLKRFATQHATSDSAQYTLSRVLHYVVLVIGVWAALSAMGIPLDKLALFAGALGVGIGFGLQAIFSNFISGLILLFDRSLKVGDFVQLGSGVQGEVRDIQIRATRITTTDNIDILVPNSKFITDNVINLTWGDASRRQHIPFGVAYGSDKATVRKAALEAAAAVPFTVLDDERHRPALWLAGFGDSALDFELLVWLKPEAARRDVNAAYRWALHDALEKYHIEMPFPQRDLHVKSWPESAGDGAHRPRRVHAPDNALRRQVEAPRAPAARSSMEPQGTQAHGQDH